MYHVSQQEATSSLKLSNVAGIFYLLLCGIVIGVTMALGEFFYKTSVEARYRKVCRTHALHEHVSNTNCRACSHNVKAVMTRSIHDWQNKMSGKKIESL